MTDWIPFDAADFLDSEEMIAEYLAACAETGDETLLRSALADVARVRGTEKPHP